MLIALAVDGEVLADQNRKSAICIWLMIYDIIAIKLMSELSLLGQILLTSVAFSIV